MAIKLKSRSFFAARQHMNLIVAAPTKHNAVINFVPKSWVVSPRLDMVDNKLSGSKGIIAFLANSTVSSNTFVTPVLVSKVVSPLLIAHFMLRLSSFGSALQRGVRFITTYSRTKPLSSGLVWVAISSLITPFTLYVSSSFAHHFEFTTGGK